MNEEEKALEKQRFHALLESQHTFPGSYMFKIIYRNEDGVDARIREVISEATGAGVTTEMVSVRASSGAKFLSMTLELNVQTAQEVLDVYEALGTVEGIVSWF